MNPGVQVMNNTGDETTPDFWYIRKYNLNSLVFFTLTDFQTNTPPLKNRFCEAPNLRLKG